MSARIILDFNDDGAVVMTSKHAKGEEPRERPIKIPSHVGIAGGQDEQITAHVLVLDDAAWKVLKDMNRTRVSVVVGVSGWSTTETAGEQGR